MALWQFLLPTRDQRGLEAECLVSAGHTEAFVTGHSSLV